jgi:hypothetical protein
VEGGYNQFVLKLSEVKLDVLTLSDLPVGLKVEVLELATALTLLLYPLAIHDCTYIVASLWCRLSIFDLLEPCVVLPVEFPVFLLQLNCCHVLLVRSLVVVEHKEESVQVKLREVLSSVVHRHSWEHVLVN